jgi:AcrR family transcriptional regulator
MPTIGDLWAASLRILAASTITIHLDGFEIMALSRPKQPELLRARILEAAQGEGLAAVTHDRVLARTGISKGGLQHHFRTKQLLLDALFDQLFASFVAQYELALAQEPAGPARRMRAYVKASRRNALDVAHSGRATVLLALGDEQYQARWSRFLDETLAPDTLDGATLLACRLAADGLWYSLVFGPVPSAAEVDAALHRILQLTEERP